LGRGEDLLSYLACIWLLLLLLLLDHNSHFGGYITKIDKNRKNTAMFFAALWNHVATEIWRFKNCVLV